MPISPFFLLILIWLILEVRLCCETGGDRSLELLDMGESSALGWDLDLKLPSLCSLMTDDLLIVEDYFF